MWLDTLVNRLRPPSRPAVDQDTAPWGDLKAVRLLEARGLADARRQAERVLESARECGTCARLMANRFERLGSTLFLDDDPEALVRAFGEGERDGFSTQVLAACIVLQGRERVVPVPY